jgi:queuine/archaeosine tRNA-ribosyltransferase
MPKYVCKHDVKHDGKEYKPGDEIELTEEQAAAMQNAVEQKIVVHWDEGTGKKKEKEKT